MGDDGEEEKSFVDALKTDASLIVEGHSGHRLRFYHDNISYYTVRAGLSGYLVPVPVLVVSPGSFLDHLRHSDTSMRHVFFVNTDLCAASVVQEILHHRCSARQLKTFMLRKLHHRSQGTLRLLEALERKSVAAAAAATATTADVLPLSFSFDEGKEHPLIVPEESASSERASRLLNSVDAALAAGTADVRSFFSRWIPDADGRHWTDTYVLECTFPFNPCSDSLLTLRAVARAAAGREVALLDVSDIREGVERVALCLPFSSSEVDAVNKLVKKVITGARGVGWVLVAQTSTPVSCQMPHRGIHLWRGARVIFRDGRMGTIQGFETAQPPCNIREGWPLVRMDDEMDDIIVSPSTSLHRLHNLRLSELPFRYADTVTVEELFLASPQPFFARRRQQQQRRRCSWVLRPSLFLGRLSHLRCAIASVPSLSQLALTSSIPWELLMATEGS